MAELNNDVFDSGLSTLTSSTETLHILSADPGLTWANIATYTLGNKSGPSVGSPTDRTGGGRKVTISATTDGNITGTGTATYYALTDDSDTKILASAALNSSQSITAGNTFTLTEFEIGIPDPA